MTVTGFLAGQEPEKKKILTGIHEIILRNHPGLKAKIAKMMGKDMIIYEMDEAFVYALSSVKTHMSLHNIVMYSYAPVYAKYSKLLSKAKFQKGCINFKNAEQMPLETVRDFIKESYKAAPQYLAMYKARMTKKK